MNENKKKIVELSDEELMDLVNGGYVSNSIQSAISPIMLYGIRPMYGIVCFLTRR